MKVIINSPSLDPKENVSGISSVVQFIINNNQTVEYVHFEVGKRDTETSNIFYRIRRIFRNRNEWIELLKQSTDALIHYNIPLMFGAIIRDFILLQVAHKMKLPIVLHIHGGYYLKNRKRPWYIRKMLKSIFSWSKEVITLSGYEENILKEDFLLNNTHILPNCVDLTEAKIFHRVIEDDKPLSILYLGRIEKNKGIDYIIDACKILNDEGFNFFLTFAGKEEKEGEYLPILQQTLGDKFIYHGVVFGDVKTRLIKQCDVFLLPSFFEGLPMSLIETMSFGEIPLVTNVGSISSLIEDNINGLFIQVKNIEDIVRDLKMLKNNYDLRHKLSVAAQKTIFTLYDDKKYVEKLNGLYGQ